MSKWQNHDFIAKTSSFITFCAFIINITLLVLSSICVTILRYYISLETAPKDKSHVSRLSLDVIVWTSQEILRFKEILWQHHGSLWFISVLSSKLWRCGIPFSYSQRSNDAPTAWVNRQLSNFYGWVGPQSYTWWNL